MKRIIGIFIVELSFISLSHTSNFSSGVKQSGINYDDNIGYALFYLEDLMDWNSSLNSDQKTILNNVHEFINAKKNSVSSDFNASSTFDKTFIELIDYINKDFYENIYGNDALITEKTVKELKEKYTEAVG